MAIQIIAADAGLFQPRRAARLPIIPPPVQKEAEMSTIAYAALTSRRDEAPPGTSRAESPGVGMYVDALAALVPAEVLTLHGLILTATTTRNGDTFAITALGTLRYAFFGLLALAIAVYVAARLMKHRWENLDYARMFIPPLAFVGWTMLQKATAFDAVSHLPDAARTVIALFLAVVLGGAATILAYKADALDANRNALLAARPNPVVKPG